MGEKVIHHFCHQHPLILTKNLSNKETLYCYGCYKPIILESAYICIQHNYCSSKITLHKRCGELPRQFLHPSHPHPLYLFHYQRKGYRCDVCRGKIKGKLGYRCTGCDFDIDISCQQLEEKSLQHPSHHHPLTLMRRKAFLFDCDGCGTEDKDMAYICTTCEFWIHKTRASLPTRFQTDHHHHQLSLAFCFPFEHRNFEYKCDVCHKEFQIMNWVCYCGDCRYFAHVKCATKKIIPTQSSSNLNTEEKDGTGLIQLPVQDISKELITPFIIRENGFDKIPADIKDMPATIVMPDTTSSFSMLFNYHNHPLSLVSEGEGPTSNELMICDVCVTPVSSPPYYKCATCKYFVHSPCYFLPKTLSRPPDSQLHLDCPDHKLRAYSTSNSDRKAFLVCKICKFLTNGMVYQCENCKVIVNVKCASLPTTIKHASHPQHKLIQRRIPAEESDRRCGCGFTFEDHDSPASDRPDYDYESYYESPIVAYYWTDNDCDFVLTLNCVLRPQSIKHESEKHPLLLTYDASINHPTDFYCEACEREMHPKQWMYHCRECDYSFHTYCLTASGWFRNIKFGRQFEFDHRLHPHPLTYNLVTLKFRCDACDDEWYKLPGLECASCNYAMCSSCGFKDQIDEL